MANELLVKELKKSVETNLDDCIIVLKDFAEKTGQSNDFMNNTLMHSAQWNSLKKQINKNTIRKDEEDFQKAKIRQALFDLIDEIKAFPETDYHFPYHLLAAGKDKNKLSAEDKIYLQLDRLYQEQHFVEILAQKKDIQGPQVFIVQGNTSDGHHGLIFRLCHILQQEYNMPSMNFDLPPLKKINDKAKLKNNLKFNLSKKLTEKSPLPLKSQIRQIINKPTASELCELAIFNENILTIDQCIYSKNWTTATKEITQDWFINQFWNFSFESRQLPVFIFLNFIHDSRKGIGSFFFDKSKSIVKDIEELSQSNKERIHILPKLNYIEYQDVADFLEEYGILKINHIIKENQKLPFVDIYEKCKNILNEYLKNQDKKL